MNFKSWFEDAGEVFPQSNGGAYADRSVGSRIENNDTKTWLSAAYTAAALIVYAIENKHYGQSKASIINTLNNAELALIDALKKIK